MRRDQAQTGARVAWTLPNGVYRRGTVLAAPADQSENVLVAWEDLSGQHSQPLPIAPLRYIPEAGR